MTYEEKLISSCCFQDLLNPEYDDTDLAGMGTAIIGNVCKMLKGGDVSEDRDLEIHLQMDQEAKPVKLPWPGMPDDGPVPLNVDKLPFDAVPFYEKEDGKFKRLIDRQGMMMRIRELWVPHLKSLMKKEGMNG